MASSFAWLMRASGRARVAATPIPLAVLVVLVVLAALAVSGVVPSASAAAPAPVPPPPATVPAGIEGLAAYVPADSCDPTDKPGTVALGALLTTTYAGSRYDITRVCGTDPLPTSEHYDGRAVDWTVSVRRPAQKAQAQAFLTWLFATDGAGNRYANARRLGIMYIIWNNKIWGAYRAADGWRKYSSCASHPGTAWDTTCHRNHMHLSLSWEGAMGDTSYWSGQVAAPDYGPCRAADMNWAAPYVAPNPTRCPSYPPVRPGKGASALDKALVTYSGMRVARYSTGPSVRAVQQSLAVKVTGRFNPATRAAIKAWQTAQGLTPWGIVNLATWRTLLAANAP